MTYHNATQSHSLFHIFPMSSDHHEHFTGHGYLQSDGLVISSAALMESGLLFDRNTRPLHQEILNKLRVGQA